MAEKRSFQDVLNYAIDREREAYAFYDDLAQKVDNEKLRNALEELALDEYQHRIHLEAVRNGEVAMKPELVGSLRIAELLKDIPPTNVKTYADLLKLAMSREKAAYRLYAALAHHADDFDTRALFAQLAQEEAKHKLRLEIEYDLETF